MSCFLSVSRLVVVEQESAAAQQYSRQGCPTGLRADLWALILNSTNQPQVVKCKYTDPLMSGLHSGGIHQLSVFYNESTHTQLQWLPNCMFFGKLKGIKCSDYFAFWHLLRTLKLTYGSPPEPQVVHNLRVSSGGVYSSSLLLVPGGQMQR